MTRTARAVAILTIAAAVWVTNSGPVRGQPPPDQNQNPMQQAAQMHQKMMAEMKAMDAELDQLVAKMNAAKGDDRINAMATLLTKLVQQRSAMQDRMMQMHDQMMGQMMQRMSPGMRSPGAPIQK